MKIACVSDDQRTISAHFGRAAYYVVLTAEDGKITGRETRAKLGHQQLAGAEQPGGHQGPHGLDSASHDRHTAMAGAIADCQVLLSRGMGYGAYQSLESLGVRPLITDIADIDAAVQAYLRGELVDHTELLH
ncbi:MAG: NifB/NifX family molybdenum-iron cluster-binding protein [Anaerolineae bacterium]